MLTHLVTAVALALGGVQAAPGWLDDYQALEAQIGERHLADKSSANLAWGESYVMRSYLDVYRKTGDTAWLDKLTAHADTVIAHADDIDGDGFLGWSTARYSPVELLNPSFESGTGSLPADWTRFQDSGTHIYRTTDVPAGTGTRSVRVVSDLTRWKKLRQPVNSAYEGGTRHVLRGWGKRTGSVTGRVVLRDGSTTLCMLEYTTSTWTYKETTCLLPAGRSLEVWLEHNTYTVSGSAYFDDVKLSGLFPYIVHDAMIGIPIAEFIRLVAQTPDLSAYAAKATSYRAFLEQEIVPRWESSPYIGNTWRPIGTTEGTYVQSPNLDTFSHTRPSSEQPYNMVLGFANLLMVLHSVNGDPAYLDRALRIARWARNDLVGSGGAYIWNYATYTTTKEDLSHANVDLSAFLEFYRQGQVFTTADMIALKNTLKSKMWNGSTTAPAFSLRVDGSGSAGVTDYFLHSWLELTEWDPQVGALVATKYTGFAPDNSAHLITLARLVKWE
ncbi:hypothetical protein FHU36_000245 [Nonomuraea muscovyensis]|uniref:Hydrolase n=1 Tax=Nonomuraea muscovyensis TaxID=1124761 RepID=A0A7X0BYB9_9ACTN|nr:hypothetical protein [Nonomuraea muscovyensis]MBB6343736.1 hypothetical protein [Nonomuraea muscovyensis]